MFSFINTHLVTYFRASYATPAFILKSLQVFVGNDGANLLHLNQPFDMKKLRIFYMEGLNTPLVQTVDSECLQAMKKVHYDDAD